MVISSHSIFVPKALKKLTRKAVSGLDNRNG